ASCGAFACRTKPRSWRPGLDSNQAGRPCTASASPLRHRAEALVPCRCCPAPEGSRKAFVNANRCRVATNGRSQRRSRKEPALQETGKEVHSDEAPAFTRITRPGPFPQEADADEQPERQDRGAPPEINVTPGFSVDQSKGNDGNKDEEDEPGLHAIC